MPRSLRNFRYGGRKQIRLSTVSDLQSGAAPRQRSYSIVSLPPNKTDSAPETRCLSWTNLALGALIPLSIGIGTVIITVMQQKVDDRRTKQELDIDTRRYLLDQLLANLSRENDLDIEERRYNLDHHLANLSRAQDLEIEERRYTLDLHLANLSRMQDLAIDDRRYNLEQEQADERYYQDVFKTYMIEMSNVIFKQQSLSWNQSTFADNKNRSAYIRSHTLTALRASDWKRKTDVFLFLYENKLLPREELESSNRLAVDLSTANLANISIISTFVMKFVFSSLVLKSIDLKNASFIDCEFYGDGTSFVGCEMSGIQFRQSQFGCPSNEAVPLCEQFCESPSFHGTSLEGADFSGATFHGVVFNRTNLAYANFSRAIFHGGTFEIIDSNAAYIDLTGVKYCIRVIFHNSNFTGAQWNLPDTRNIINSLLPDGVWVLEGKNVVRNGDAEMGCTSNRINYGGWDHQDDRGLASYASNTNPRKLPFLGNCYFEFTNGPVRLHQKIMLDQYSLLVGSGNGNYNISMHFACEKDNMFATSVIFYDVQGHRLESRRHTVPGTNLTWKIWTGSSNIPTTTRWMELIPHTSEPDTCYADNFKLFITHKK